jgi:hypothetical protein
MTVVVVFAVESRKAAERKREEESMNHRWHWMPQTEVKNMKRIRRTLCLLMFSAVATLALAASATAQTVVVGTGNPDIDVPAVQAAVDQGGEVILNGHFSFDRPPTVPTAPELAVQAGSFATVLVSKAVVISGTQEDDEEMASIEAGTIPFYVDAPGASVTIQGLRFIRPKGSAVLVYSVSGLVIASCRIEGVEPVLGGAAGIAIITLSGTPSPTKPGKPENISGTLWIVDNDLDLAGGTSADIALGIALFGVGVPGAEVEAYISGNTIRNVNEPAINVNRVVGRVYVERNVITTGSLGLTGRIQAIRVVNLGSYLIAHNSIDCGWVQGMAEGIGVFSQFAAWPMEGAVVVGNHITMSAPEGTVFSDFSAAIAVFGFAEGNVVRNNRIRGRARAALSVPVSANAPSAVPANNAFLHNHFDDFEASVADVFVGPTALNTLIVGAGTVEDLGTGTIIVEPTASW